jgi:hypothetical protein
VEGGFKAVRQAVKGSEVMSTAHSTWSARLFATYHETIPSVEVGSYIFLVLIRPIIKQRTRQIEILNCGETGPKRINATNIMMINHIPFLSVSEFLRAKMNAWLRCVLSHCALCSISN